MFSMYRPALALVAAVSVLCGAPPAGAGAPDPGAAPPPPDVRLNLSGPVASHWRGGGRVNAAQSADALLLSYAASRALKGIVRERRPDSDERDSFPSGHATLAFALATVQSHHDPDRSFLWYAGATAIGVSRVTSDRHYAHDVLAGALLGHWAGRSALTRHRGLRLLPEYSPSQGTFQVSLRAAF